MTFRFPGDDDITVDEGEILGYGSSREPGKDRWTELTIVGTDRMHYLVAGVGKSTVEGETDRHWLAWYEGAADMVKGLLRPDGRGGKSLPRYARDAATNAAEIDGSIAGALGRYDEALAWTR